MAKKRVYVAGHQGMVGSAICRELSSRIDIKLVLRTHAELDLTSQLDVQEFSRLKILMKFILQQLRLGVFMPIIPILLSSSIRI